VYIRIRESSQVVICISPSFEVYRPPRPRNKVIVTSGVAGIYIAEREAFDK
jgi:hypothetical protein